MMMMYGCAEKNSLTTTSVRFIGADLLRGLDGDIIVTGYSTNSDPPTYFSLPITSPEDELDLNLPNGDWHFAAVGWTGSSRMEGNLRCSQEVPLKTLAGVATSFSIILDIFQGKN